MAARLKERSRIEEGGQISRTKGGGNLSTRALGQRRLLCAVLLAGASIFALGPVASARGAESKDAEAVVEALQNRVNATADFVAEFRQETEIKTLNRTIKAVREGLLQASGEDAVAV